MKRKRPFTRAAPAIAGGMILASLVPPGTARILFAVILTVTIMLLMYVFNRRRSLSNHTHWIIAALFIFGYVYFLIYDMNNRSLILQELSSDPIYSVHQVDAFEWAGQIRGIINSAPQFDGDLLKTTVRINEIYHRGEWKETGHEKVQIFLKLLNDHERQQANFLEKGDRVEARLSLQFPDPPTNPGAFDYPRYLYYQHIHLIGRAEGLSSLEVISKSSFPVWGWTDRLRNWLIQQTGRIFLPESAAVFQALLFGSKNNLSAVVEERFSILGLSHVMAISGLHVGVVSALVLASFLRMGFTRETAIKVTLFFLPVYAILTGFTPSVVRASLMGMVALTAWLIQRSGDPWNTLGLAFFVMIISQPYYLWQIGFQLSFALTAGLIWLVPLFSRYLPVPYKRLRQLTAVTLAAQVISFPFTVYYFHQYSLLSTFANLIFVPILAGIFIPLGFITFIIGLIHPSMVYLFSVILEWMWLGILHSLQWLEQLQWFHRSWAPPAMIGLLLYFLFLWGGTLLFTSTLSRKRKWLLSTLIVFFWTALVYPLTWNTESTGEDVRITFLDVGQGDSTVIEFPDGQAYLIDGGGRPFWQGMDQDSWKMRKDPFEPGKDVVVPFLRYRGISVVDTMVMTHGDLDHIGGLQAVTERFPIKRVIGNGLPPNGVKERALFESLLQKEVPILHGKEGAIWKIRKGVTLTLLHPPAFRDRELILQDNNMSVVLLLSAYGRHVLLTGDLEQNGEEWLMNRSKLIPPGIDILKVAHHGSDTSTTENWLQFLHPTYAIISVGENRYGHPSEKVLERLESRKVPVVRTDLHGAITVRITPQGELKIKTVLTPRR